MLPEPKGNQQGTPAQPAAPGQEPPSSATEPSYITPEALDARFSEWQKAIDERLNNTYRGIQSMTAKVKPQLEQLDRFVETLTKSGQAVDPNVVQRMKTDILTQAYSAEAPDSGPAPPAPPPAPGQGAPADQQEQWISNLVTSFDTAFGVELNDDDPEIETIPHIDDVGQEKFVEAVRQAYLTKRLRLAQGTQKQATARSPLMGAFGAPSTNPLQGKHGASLWEEVKKQNK